MSRPDAPPPAASGPPPWVSRVIALVPVVPPLYLAAFTQLRQLRHLPPVARWVLFAFAVTQLLATVLTPQPLLSLGLAALRILLLLAMVGAGAFLREPRTLRALLPGYAVVFISAWGYALATLGPAALSTRLGHPYYYIVSLGLIATVALWLLLRESPSAWWFWPMTLLSAGTLLATQSRGPLLALLVGCAAAALRGHRRYLWPLAAAVPLGLVLLLGGTGRLDRLASDDLSGRDQVWQGALLAFRDQPLGGQGPYQAGPYYWYLSSTPCQLTPSLEDQGVHCPAWADALRGAWLTAHNVVLHSLAETGLIGTLGLLLLLSLVGYATWVSGDSLLVAVFWGYLAMSMLDVVTAGPSPHFAELFWVVAGLALVRLPQRATPSSPPDPA
ncbi:O-antigen ligase family protein [Deinococcus sp. DB0503]|uniref:O-antigen ligase family protein n=1 Tax=Deinococcus sp. DB0503 TaxID=2479203 RepID=UPI00351CA50A